MTNPSHCTIRGRIVIMRFALFCSRPYRHVGLSRSAKHDMIESLNKERRRVQKHTTPPVHPLSLPLAEQTTNERCFAGYIDDNRDRADNYQHPKTRFVLHVCSPRDLVLHEAHSTASLQGIHPARRCAHSTTSLCRIDLSHALL